MATEKLAIHGGPKTITKSFKHYNSIGKEEVDAAKAVVESGVLSQFLGCWDPDFYGGPKVQEFERACEKYFGVKHVTKITPNGFSNVALSPNVKDGTAVGGSLPPLSRAGRAHKRQQIHYRSPSCRPQGEANLKQPRLGSQSFKLFLLTLLLMVSSFYEGGHIYIYIYIYNVIYREREM